jgi:hypothetical protein
MVNEVSRARDILDTQQFIMYILGQIALGNTSLNQNYQALYILEDKLDMLMGEMPIQLELDFNSEDNVLQLFGNKDV